MKLTSIKTPLFVPPKDDLRKLLSAIPTLHDGQIVAISSKIISIIEGRCYEVEKTNLEELIVRESTRIYRPARYKTGMPVLTLKDGLLTETAGIDRSNANGHYILLPRHPLQTCYELWTLLRKRDKLKKVGVIITDSHAIPSRRGAIGMALASYGFRPVYYANSTDLFGRHSTLGATNIAESIAVAAVAEMGEGDEQTPIVIISDIRQVQFNQRKIALFKQKKFEFVPKNKDVYSPLILR